jgi:glycosyltransferase 2 family protein
MTAVFRCSRIAPGSRLVRRRSPRKNASAPPPHHGGARYPTLAARTRHRVWAVVRMLGGTAILAIIVSRLGTGPFLHGLSAVSGWSLAAAAGITALTTVCSAWRWSLVARGLGVAVPLRTATAAYYRSQFLNIVLPGGVLGDVDRAVRHGRGAGDVGRGLRAVAWERFAGQVVQLALALSVLLLLPSPVPPWVSLVVAAAVVGALGAGVLIRGLRPRGMSPWARSLRAARTDLRVGLLARRSWPGIALASVVVVAGHLATLFFAAHATGVTSSTLQFLPLAMLVLVAMAVPTHVGGWGPREGMAAWVFGAAGLGADLGVATATAYGVLALAAILPGAPLVAAAWLRRRRGARLSAAGPRRPSSSETHVNVTSRRSACVATRVRRRQGTLT